MGPLTPDRISVPLTQSDAIREICRTGITEPENIWDALEAKGINATPSLLFQAILDLEKMRFKPRAAANGERVLAGNAPGLTVEDVATMSSLADKAGGVDQLVRLLGLIQCPHPSTSAAEEESLSC